jgi:hypothetical protein
MVYNGGGDKMSKENKMFSKLNSKVRATKLSESAMNFKDISERRRFEEEVVFGDLLEELSSVDIESAYASAINEEEIDPVETAEMMRAKAEQESAQARERVQVAAIDKQIESMKKRMDTQIDRLQDRKQRMVQNESLSSEQAKQVFFMGREGGILNYLVNGELAMIDPEHKALAKKFKGDLAIRDMVEKVRAQLSLENPNMDLLKVLKYKIISRIEMLERLHNEREGK